jgi:hypothetical protein
MMGRLEQDQTQLFYSFCLEEVVAGPPSPAAARAIASVLDLSWAPGDRPAPRAVIGWPKREDLPPIRWAGPTRHQTDAGTARPRLLRISGGGKSVVAVTGEATRLPALQMSRPLRS